MKFVQIYKNKAWWIFEASEKPEFAPNIVIKDITNNPEIKEGWDYNPESDTFTPPVVEPPQQVGPTIGEQLAKLQSDNLTLMSALADIYADMAAKGTV